MDIAKHLDKGKVTIKAKGKVIQGAEEFCSTALAEDQQTDLTCFGIIKELQGKTGLLCLPCAD